MGKLIVIEGLDGSGKSTQLDLLPKGLLQNGFESRSVSFPNYSDDSSALVTMYLAGQFVTKPMRSTASLLLKKIGANIIKAAEL